MTATSAVPANAAGAKPPRPALEGLVAYLAALVGGAPAGQLIELRYRRSAGGMGQRFFPIERPDAAAAAIAVLGRRGDLYVGASLRARREGTRDALAAGWALWADCDGDAAAGALLCEGAARACMNLVAVNLRVGSDDERMKVLDELAEDVRRAGRRVLGPAEG